MASWGPLYPTSNGTNSSLGLSAGTSAYVLIDNDPTTGQPDSDYIENLYNTATAYCYLGWTDISSPFVSMDSVTVQLYIVKNGTRDNDNTYLYAGITTADGGSTYLAGQSSSAPRLVLSWTGTTTPANGLYSISFPYISTSASSTSWDNSYLYLYWTKSKSGGWDSTNVRVYALSARGQKSIGAIPLTADLDNAPQTFAADVDVAVSFTADVTNAAQDFAAVVTRPRELTADITNAAQDFYAFGASATLSCDIGNKPQLFIADNRLYVAASDTTGQDKALTNLGPFWYNNYLYVPVRTAPSLTYGEYLKVYKNSVTGWVQGTFTAQDSSNALVLESSTNSFIGLHSASTRFTEVSGAATLVTVGGCNTYGQGSGGTQSVWKASLFDLTTDLYSYTETLEQASNAVGSDPGAEGFHLITVDDVDNTYFLIIRASLAEYISGTYYDRISIDIWDGTVTWQKNQAVDGGGSSNYHLRGFQLYTSGSTTNWRVYHEVNYLNYYTQAAPGSSPSWSSPTAHSRSDEPVLPFDTHNSSTKYWSIGTAGGYEFYKNSLTPSDAFTGNYSSWVAGSPIYGLNNGKVPVLTKEYITEPLDYLKYSSIPSYYYAGKIGVLTSNGTTEVEPVAPGKVLLGAAYQYIYLGNSTNGYVEVAVDRKTGTSTRLYESGTWLLRYKIPTPDLGNEVTAAFTNVAQDFAASVSIEVSFSAALNNAAQDFALDAAVEIQITADLSNVGQDFAADVVHNSNVIVDLTNSGQSFAADVDITCTLDAAVTNDGQAFSADVDITVSLSAALTNSGQAFAADTEVEVSLSSALTNAAQTFAADVTAVEGRTVTADLDNAPQTFAADVKVVCTIDALVANVGQAFAASVSVERSLSCSLNNAPQDFAATIRPTPLRLDSRVNQFEIAVGQRRSGPWRYGSNWYIIGADWVDDALHVMYTTGASPYNLWVRADSSNAPHPPDAYGGAIAPGRYDALLDGTVLHIVGQHSQGGSHGVIYEAFSVSNNTWMMVSTSGNTGYYEIIPVSSASTTDPYYAQGVSLSLRTDGDLVATHFGLTEEISGGYYTRAAYSIKTTNNTWQVQNVNIDEGGLTDWRNHGHFTTPGDTSYVGYFDVVADRLLFRTLTGNNTLSATTTTYAHQFNSAAHKVDQLRLHGGVRGMSSKDYTGTPDTLKLYFWDSGVFSRKIGTPFAASIADNPLAVGDGKDRIYGIADIGASGIHKFTYIYSQDLWVDNGTLLAADWDKGSTMCYNTGGLVIDNSTLWVTYGQDNNYEFLFHTNFPTYRYLYDVELANEGQTFAASLTLGALAVSLDADLVNDVQTFAASVDVICTLDALLTNGTQDFAADVDVTCTFDAEITNAGQTFYASLGQVLRLTVDLTNDLQTFNADVDVGVSASAALVNDAQTFAADASVLVQLSALLTNAEQDFAASVDVAVSLTALLSNAAQSFVADVDVVVAADALLSNVAQDFAASLSLPVSLEALLTNAGQTFAAALERKIQLSADLTNSGQTFAASVQSVSGLYADLTNAAQDFAASASVEVQFSVDVSNAGQVFAANISPVATLDADLANSEQDFAANVVHAPLTVDASLVNSAQSFDAEASVVCSVFASLTNESQSFQASVSPIVGVASLLNNSEQTFAADIKALEGAYLSSDLSNVAQGFGAVVEITVQIGADFANEGQIFEAELTHGKIVDIDLINAGQGFSVEASVLVQLAIDIANGPQGFRTWLQQRKYFLYDSALELVLYKASLDIERFSYEADVEIKMVSSELDLIGAPG